MSRDQDSLASIEVQLPGGSSAGTQIVANLGTPLTNIVMNDELVMRHGSNSSQSPTMTTAEAVVLGGETIWHWLDGEVVLEN